MWGIHAGALIAIVACLFLGRWQWARTQETHSAQNAFYAFEWWSFALIALVVWIKTVQDELKPAPHPDAPVAGAPPTTDPASVAAALADAEDDEEMAAYNAYLAHLAANPRD